jgi:hypothetical protein
MGVRFSAQSHECRRFAGFEPTFVALCGETTSDESVLLTGQFDKVSAQSGAVEAKPNGYASPNWLM